MPRARRARARPRRSADSAGQPSTGVSPPAPPSSVMRLALLLLRPLAARARARLPRRLVAHARLDGIQDPVHEGRRIRGAETLGQLHRLVDHDRGGRPRLPQELVDGQAVDVLVDGGDTVEAPVVAGPGDLLVQAGQVDPGAPGPTIRPPPPVSPGSPQPTADSRYARQRAT